MKYLFKKSILILILISYCFSSYAALSASDGDSFVTKAEFDSALADFNSRLTTFEAGINSKIDSQVTSYLDKNGIWAGKLQTLEVTKNTSYANPDSAALVYLIKNITKSGLVVLPFYIWPEITLGAYLSGSKDGGASDFCVKGSPMPMYDDVQFYFREIKLDSAGAIVSNKIVYNDSFGLALTGEVDTSSAVKYSQVYNNQIFKMYLFFISKDSHLVLQQSTKMSIAVDWWSLKKTWNTNTANIGKDVVVGTSGGASIKTNENSKYNNWWGIWEDVKIY